MTRRKLIAFIALPLMLAAFYPAAAHADCANPTGVKGEFVYNDDHDTLQFCDGTDWIGMSGGSSGGGGAGVTDGDKGDITVSGSGANWMIDDDVLDFTEFADAMTLDASTTITISGSNVLTLTNTGTGDSLVVMDQASDTTPFVIDTAGNVGIGLAAPSQALDVVGKITGNSLIVKATTGAAAPTGGSGSSGQWTTDGTHVWRATGNVGVGTATPGERFTVSAPSATDTKIEIDANGDQYAGIRIKNSIAGWLWQVTPTAGSGRFRLINTVGPSEVLTVLQSGNIGIGATNPAWPLHIRNGVAPVIQLEEVDSSGNAFIGVDGNNLFIRRGTIGTSDAMTITSGGNVGIGTVSPQAGLHVATLGTAWAALNTPYGYHNQNTYGQSGAYATPVQLSIYTPGRVVVGEMDATSDRRKKKDIADISAASAMDFIAKARPVRFYWKDRETKESFGFIAQEISKAGFDNLIALSPDETIQRTVDDDGFESPQGLTLNMNYDGVIPLLTKAIQQFKADNDNMRSELDALRAEIEALKAAR